MFRHTLLLNNNCDVHSFISERNSIKLYLRGCVDVLSAWSDYFLLYNEKINYPATLKLKYLIRIPNRKLAFNRYAVFKRDDFTCQYCGIGLPSDELTMDHIIPKKLGGISSFMNCVAACYRCNNRKGSRTLAESGLQLKQQPYVPPRFLSYPSRSDTVWHPDWNFYI